MARLTLPGRGAGPLVSRRGLLAGGLGLAGLAALQPGARAFGPVGSRRFIFVFCQGGWDTTRCFSADVLGRPGIEVEPQAVVREANGLRWVSGPRRPSVDSFFERFGHRVALLDGMLIRSVNHRVCERLAMTASSRPGSPDWPTRLGAGWASDVAVPSIVISGPTEPGYLNRYSGVSGRGAQLQALIDGSVVDWSAMASLRLARGAEPTVDALVTRRLERALSDATHPAWQRMLDASDDATARALRLRDDAAPVPIDVSSLREELMTAVDLLAHGVCRCVSVALQAWDTHGDNVSQPGLYERLFDGLIGLAETLQATPVPGGGTMADDTVVVVLSELGRTPYLNQQGGKDHWPYTAAMLMGPGVAGGRQIGGYDDNFSGLPVDLRTGGVGATVLSPEHLGATVLTLGGLDVGVELPGAEPIRALLA